MRSSSLFFSALVVPAMLFFFAAAAEAQSLSELCSSELLSSGSLGATQKCTCLCKIGGVAAPNRRGDIAWVVDGANDSDACSQANNRPCRTPAGSLGRFEECAFTYFDTITSEAAEAVADGLADSILQSLEMKGELQIQRQDAQAMPLF